MAKKLIVKTQHKFSGMGQLGAALFIVTPIATAITMPLLLRELARTYGGDVTGPAIVLFLAGFGATVSIPMMLIGRQSLHIAETVEDDGKADDLWSNWSKAGPIIKDRS